MRKIPTKTKHTVEPACVGTTTMGERGQLVVPIEARKVLKLKEGDKLLVFINHGKMLGLVKADSLRSFLSTLTKHLTRFTK